jgi:uncharacterized membrane protein
MDFITAFFGRFHPLLIHLPIGILLLAFLFECLSARSKSKALRKAVQPALFLGAIFTVASAITGYFLRQEGGYEQKLADLHQNFGIATAVLAIAVYALRRRAKFWFADPVKRKQVRIALFIPLILFLLFTGHWGGSLTHGEDYLFAAVYQQGRQVQDPAVRMREITHIDKAVFYDDVIQPILEARCYDCHSSTKQKGDLRLDKQGFITRGGEHGEIIREGPADSSALYRRLVLPVEDEDHMPPGEKPQLSSSEIALIKYWVEEGAGFDQPIARFGSEDKITAIIRSLQEAPREFWVPEESVGPASENALGKLKGLGIAAMPLAAGNNYLMVNFSGIRDVTEEQINSLQEIRQQLVWLNLSHTRISDQQMEAVSRLGNLRVLNLNNTGITDTGVAKLVRLHELRSLSLVGTRVTDQSVAVFLELKRLANLFLFQTSLTDPAIKNLLDARDELKVDTGNYRLEKLPTDTLVYKKISAK